MLSKSDLGYTFKLKCIRHIISSNSLSRYYNFFLQTRRLAQGVAVLKNVEGVLKVNNVEEDIAALG